MAGATALPGLASPGGYPPIAVYSNAELGFDGRSTSIAQDADNVLYFAGAGLLTMDGDRWNYSPAPGTYLIRCIALGPDGRLWAGGIGELGWFSRTADNRWKYHSLIAQLPKEFASFQEAWTVFPDEEGVTFVTAVSILRWNGSSFAGWHKPGARRLFGSKSGKTVFVHFPAEGLYTVDAKGPHMFIPRAVLGDAAVLSVEQRGDRWLLGTADGFYLTDGRTLTPFAPAVRDFIREHRITTSIRLPDGRLAFGSLTGGLTFLRPDGTLDLHMDTSSGLPSAYVGQMFVAQDGDLWVTSTSHTYRVELSQASTVFDERSGLPRESYRNIVQFADRIAVANDNGVYVLGRNDARFSRVASLGGRWDALLPTEFGLLVSGYRGAKLWDQSSTTFVFPSESDSFALARSRVRGEYLVSDNLRIVSLTPGQPARDLVPHLPDIVRSFAQDADGRLWLGSYGRGLYIADPSEPGTARAMPVPSGAGLPSLHGPTHVKIRADGTVIALAHNGAWTKARDAERFVAVENYTPHKIAGVSEPASDGSIWVLHAAAPSHRAGVGRIAFDAGGRARWTSHSVHALPHLGALRAIYADVDAEGATVLWIGGTSILRHVVGRTLSAPVPRAPLLRAYTQKAGEARRPIIDALPHSNDSIVLEFALPDFSRRASLRLETRIDGIDQSWLPVSTGSQRELTAIRDGRYTVRVRALNEAGAIGPETEFRFQVLAPWWRTSAAFAGGAVALAALAYGAYRLRVRALQQRTIELEKKVHQRTEELVRASAAKTEFVANMSHDIRNPLNGIVGLTLALEDTKLDSEQRELVSTLRDCTHYLSSLVDDVLDFASIEAGRVELRPGAFAPAELLRSIATTLKAEATQSGATLAIAIDPAVPPHVFGDAGRIQQILVNYVSNALKYAGGPIRLAATVPAQAAEEIEFSVSDSGPGLSEADRATLFTKFTRLTQPSGEEIPGTGLGLASCRLLADIMGGSVGVDSAPGAGARFYLRLPLAAVAPEPAVAAPAATDARLGQNSTVLLVEDTDYNALAATAVLRRLGLDCERARTGEEALHLFATKRFNLVLLDRNLPDMDGTEVARRLRALEGDSLPALVLAVTAYCTAADRQLCLDAGMDAFVGKPLTPDKLRKVLLAASGRLLASASFTAEPEPSSGTTMDTTLLGYLSDGTEAGLKQQIERFLRTLSDADAQLTRLHDARNFTELALSAHQLLGQAKLVGAIALGEAALALEHAARVNDQTRSTQSLQNVQAEIRAVTAALHRHHPVAAPA